MAKAYYDPLKFRHRPDIPSEFGETYEPIMPDEAEVRYIGNKQLGCYYYIHGLELCKYEVLRSGNNTFLSCKDLVDAMWRCFTSNQYGKTMEEAPDYVKPMQKQFFDCFFHKTYGLNVCMKYFTNVVRVIYRRPDSKLSKWY